MAIRYVKMAVIIKNVRIQQFRCNNCKKNYTIKTNTYFIMHINKLKFGKPQIQDIKIIHMNAINSFHSGLKKFMVRFNGVRQNI